MAVRRHISTDALRSNCRYLKKECAPARLLAVVKNNAYGHGLAAVAAALADAVDGFAVAEPDEAPALRATGFSGRIVLLHGVQSAAELKAAVRERLDVVVHSERQLALLEREGGAGELALWVKFNTGMNRLGFDVEARARVIERVEALRARELVFMSHLASADEVSGQNAEQQRRFADICSGYDYPASLANSAACLNLPESRLQWVRVGLALYGVAPGNAAAPHRAALKPVMRMTAPVIAVRVVRAGGRVGYGGDYVCENDTPVAVVAAGYGHGYPRHAPAGTPLWVAGKRRPLVGRVSMDMLTVTLDDESEVAIGDEAECWGAHIPVDEVAGRCGTIAYELLCAAGARE